MEEGIDGHKESVICPFIWCPLVHKGCLYATWAFFFLIVKVARACNINLANVRIELQHNLLKYWPEIKHINESKMPNHLAYINYFLFQKKRKHPKCPINNINIKMYIVNKKIVESIYLQSWNSLQLWFSALATKIKLKIKN